MGACIIQLLMSSIKERNEVSLSHKTIAFKGFVMSIQLVLIEAIPSLMGVVRDGPSSGSEAESEEEEASGLVDRQGKKSINTGHIRSIDSACKVNVVSIISDGVEPPNFEPDVEADDEGDVLVENLVNAFRQGFSFSNQNFKRGATKADVTRMRDLSADLSNMGVQIKDLALSLCNSQNIFQKKVEDLLGDIHKQISESISKFSTSSPVRQSVGVRTDNTSYVASEIIQEALRYTQNQTTDTRQETPNNTSGVQREQSCDDVIYEDPEAMDANSKDGVEDVAYIQFWKEAQV
ncbi:hypothetical protein HA466_0143920 [Hirschfeldia incana]|nr:hypothetical protein HA466_0143920 [Hirschfeldia incana]